MRILLISGSPTAEGSTEILLRKLGAEITDLWRRSSSARVAEPKVEFVRLNDLEFIPCQSCARSPEPEVCFYEDDLWPVYRSLIDSDIIVLGSPVFFDSVSAQTKMFIDRCSCFRPPDFASQTESRFKKIGLRPRIGAGVLVAGERGRFDLALSVMKAFFKWTEIDTVGFITYESPDFHSSGQVSDSAEASRQAHEVAKVMIDNMLRRT